MTLRSLALFVLATLTLVACGPSSAQIKTARTARYDVTASAAFQAGVAALKANDYKVTQVDPVAGRALTEARWFEVDGTSLSRDSDGRPQMTSAGAIELALEIGVVADGAAFFVQVIPHVLQHRAGYSAPLAIKEGDGAMPGWVSGKVDNVYLSIYDALKANAAVPGAAAAPAASEAGAPAAPTATP